MKSMPCSQASPVVCSSVCIHRKSGEKQGRAVSTYHVMQDGSEGGLVQKLQLCILTCRNTGVTPLANSSLNSL